MNFFKKLFNITEEKVQHEVRNQHVNLSLDDLFVHNFVNKGGKFLYSTTEDEVVENFLSILSENNWQRVKPLDKKLDFLTRNIKISQQKSYLPTIPVLTLCEHLIADNGDIMFSSNQLGGLKLSEHPENFIVFAKTSQLVKDTGQGLTGIKMNSKSGLPTNISSIKNYTIHKEEENFLNFGNSNSKNLYLLLLEDL